MVCGRNAGSIPDLGKALRYAEGRGDSMQAADVWGSRWSRTAHPLSHRFMEAAVEKQTLVVLAADLDTTAELVQLINEVGPHIAALKTHVDMVEDYTK